MKKYLIAASAAFFFMMMVEDMFGSDRAPLNTPLPVTAPFSVSNQFDGEWEGKRTDISGDNICLQTRIIGTIKEGKVSLRLMYNNTYLEGFVSDTGELALYADSQKWGYRFTGTANDDRIDGDWKVTNAVCNGTWQLEKTS
ncbi:hypothetical protein BCT30_04790 [Enterovibrio norvegicus]|uniref:Uncharacterized protein n=2 Tax=Enterovibrio norvegicus TaxID=188144 RepID=A0A1I5NMS4_9GAMM|nr:hypothetical protein [Enterovibrio norvegicus]MCC4800672.1 hypothetical protein [Enterovibrio norvegicus]OEE50798.1 hypothetical protein A1OS_23240 [Enterovibrio norvegicus]OEF55133.1 hypothetical protein A1OU_22385 [Enterovibrio norvegicus]PMH60092.1 hypothetical protein BCU62_21990 [Enterovibrio norvegicus]PMI33493.1 hypothetical protein BCU46_22100 [Enterovibrio norvegicus]